MFKNKFFNIFLVIGCFVTFFCQAQELPPIVKYTTDLYNAGNQNWMISQDKNSFMFFANNEGLLEFNGSNWELYPSPNETIIRSVKVIQDKIFTGCYMEFGFWTRKSNGKLKYTSLSQSIKSKILDDEQFWNILNYEHWIIFQSLNRIYIYDLKTKKFNIISPKDSIIKSYITNNSIYFQTNKEGLFEIENGKSKLVSNDLIIKNSRVVNVFSIDEGILIQTQSNGFYKLIGSNLSKFTIDSELEMFSNSIYSSCKLSDGGFALGTISNGVYILNKEGAIQYHITQSIGLSNNTVLSLFEDIDKNLWVGLDNGINCINLQSPVKTYTDASGMLGTIYAAILHKGKLYVGSNQGLFYKNYLSNENFSFIKGTKGQVWSLYEFDDTLFCGHDSGTFIINDGVGKLIFSQSGTWKFEKVPNQSNFLLQGNYYGISVLEKVNNQWFFRNKIEGFDYSARYFELTKSLDIYVSHEYKGIFSFKLNNSLTNATDFKTFNSPKKGKNASLTIFKDIIYYAYKEGIYKLNSKTKQFEKDTLLSNVFVKDEYTSGKMIVDASNKIWLFSKNYMHYFSSSKLSNELKQNNIPIPSSLSNSLLGYENITQLSKFLYLIGTTDGYYTININDLSFKNYNVSIFSVSNGRLNQKLSNCSIIEPGKFKHDENNVTISYTVPDYFKYINAEYQYFLEGEQSKWSEWSAKSSINFKNLSPGNYTFKVRAKISNSLPNNIAEYNFEIRKPWYASNFAIIFYVILILILARIIHKTYKSYYRKQREKLIEENNLLLEIKELEIEQQYMKVKNEKLSQDVDAKNKELAASSMSLNIKNELLNMIKDDLKENADGSNRSIKSLISTINKNISDKDSWNVFKEAFDNADKDFLKKVKSAHPILTPNDLRLCAYLRLNLSSKEIAPLLNISVRSVEIKRYRLRKKIDLPHEKGLVEYILSF